MTTRERIQMSDEDLYTKWRNEMIFYPNAKDAFLMFRENTWEVFIEPSANTIRRILKEIES